MNHTQNYLMNFEEPLVTISNDSPITVWCGKQFKDIKFATLTRSKGEGDDSAIGFLTRTFGISEDEAMKWAKLDYAGLFSELKQKWGKKVNFKDREDALDCPHCGGKINIIPAPSEYKKWPIKCLACQVSHEIESVSVKGDDQFGYRLYNDKGEITKQLGRDFTTFLSTYKEE